MALPDDAFFERLERERTAALVARDLPAIDRLHAPDYELITPAGRVFSRAEYLAAIAAEPFYAAWDLGPVRVRVGQGLAVVRYRATLQFPSGRVVECWHTDVYRQHGAEWQAVWSQATGLPAPAAQGQRW